ncbi:hypothetical protein KEM48_007957 [Puccinia striiformis f. sp. tritici PST-130]|nr:hypothetical protein KEM48_007957 [Puccinia striiformis f. sp. tritici PST-130]
MFKTALLILIIGSSMIGTTIGYTLRFKIIVALLFGLPWERHRMDNPIRLWHMAPDLTQGVRVIRSWGRTGCDGGGGNCATGACNGGLRCTDGGITSRVLLGEYGYQQFGNVISWDLSRVDGRINIDTSINNGGNVKTCRQSNCPTNQAFASPNDFQAITTSPVGSTFDITFCP